jgi:broad specificity phosphatase PhoE
VHRVLIIVRHGQTSANAAGLLLGRADLPLTELGRRQASALAAALPVPARVVSSPLLRARQTAAAFGRPVEVDERWIEMDYGRLDCQAVAAVPGDVWERWRADCHFVPAGGESLAAVGARVREACVALSAAVTEADVVVVTHVSPIKAAIAWALGAGDEVAWRMFVEDASVCRIAVGPHGPQLRAFNERHPPSLSPAP